MSEDKEVDALEQGNIYFLYRPEVEEHHPSGIADLQQFYLVLAPEGSHRFRLIVIGRKRLPDIDEHERNWGYVEAIAASAKKLEEALAEQHYQTKTRGERTLPAVRPAGEGKYMLLMWMAVCTSSMN